MAKKKISLGVGVVKAKPRYTKHGVIGGISESDRPNVSPYIGTVYDVCVHQGFGGFCLNSKNLKEWSKAICSYFDVSELNELTGKSCEIVYPTNRYNETIIGLCNPDKPGTVFLMDKFREHIGVSRLDTIDRAVESIDCRISSLTRQIDDLKDRKKQIAFEYDEIY